MRIRQIKPDFWKDPVIAGVSEGARLFYIGTWQLADDAGWMRWSVEAIGAELYPFEGRSSRERRVQRHADVLRRLERIQVAECGRHAQVPTMPSHQHLAGSTRRVYTVRDEHASRCQKARPATPRDSPPIPASGRLVSDRSGSVSKGTNEPKKPGRARHLERVNGEWRPKPSDGESPDALESIPEGSNL